MESLRTRATTLAAAARRLNSAGGPLAARAPFSLAFLTDAARGPDAVEAVGGVLKLIRVLRIRHESPSAADWLSEIVKASRDALRIVALHWSTGRRARLGADLLPVKTGRAPRYGVAPAAGTVRAA